MIYIIILMATCIVAFFMCIAAFLWGLKLGKQLGNNQLPQVTLNPVKRVMQAVEQHEAKKEAKKIDDELTDIMGATRETMLKHIKTKAVE